MHHKQLISEIGIQGRGGKICTLSQTRPVDLVIADAKLSGEQDFVLDVNDTMEALLRQEDLNQDGLITVDDDGPKVDFVCHKL